MTDKWNSNKDVNEDLKDVYVLGNNGYCDKEILSKADKVRTRLQQTRSTLFDQISNDVTDDNSENVVFCKPVRGRPLKNINCITKPGGLTSFLENQMETSAAIESACGVDFSNDTIENRLRQENKEKESNVHKRQTFAMPNIRFNSSNSRSNSATSSTSSSSSPVFSSPQSLVASDKETTKETCKYASYTDMAHDNASNDSKMSINNIAPPPLFEIIKKNSKRKPKK